MNGLFEHPAYLLGILLLAPALTFLVLRFTRVRAALLPVQGAESPSIRYLSVAFYSRTAFFSLAWLSLVVAVAEPRWGSEPVAVRQQGMAVAIVMDVSRSMGAKDLAPDRESYAAAYASLLVSRMGPVPCALVLVKGEAHPAIPLTQDHRAIHDILEILSPSLLTEPGSNIGAGIQSALRLFPAGLASARTIILFTDGDETAGSLLEAAREVRRSGSTLVIAGTGTVQGAEIEIPGRDGRYLARLREDYLRGAVEASGRGGLYVPITEAGSAQRILSLMEKTRDDGRKMVYSTRTVRRYSAFLLASIVFACLGFMSGGLLWRKD